MFKRVLSVLALCSLPFAAYAQAPLASGELTFNVNGNTVAMDCASGSVVLNPANGSASQQWNYWHLSSGIYVLQGAGCGSWNAIDFSQGWFPMGAIWDNASSPNSMDIIPSGNGFPMYIQAWNPADNAEELIVPNAAGTGIQFSPMPIGWNWQAPPPPPPPPQTGCQDSEAGCPNSPYVPANYVLYWHDEFNEAKLDQTKWFTRYANPSTANYLPSNGEQEYFEEGQDGGCNHCMITGGGVALTAYPARASDGRYPSGMLRAKETFNVGSATTGYYIEIKAKMPKAGWPALWASAEPMVNSGGSAPWPPEMDFAEFMNSKTNIGTHLQWGSGGVPGVFNGQETGYGTPPTGWTFDGANGVWDTTTDFSADYHVFSLWITPGQTGQNINPVTGKPTHNFEMEIDGWLAMKGTYDFQVGADGSCCYNLELLLDYAIGGQSGSPPSQLPDALDVQYVRVYESGAKQDAGDYVSTIGTNETCGASGC